MAEFPRITLSQLSEYLVATPGRRRSIVEEMRDPKPYIVAVYNDASDLMRRCCYAGDQLEAVADEGLQELHEKATSPVLSDMQRQSARHCIEATEAAVKIWPALNVPAREFLPLVQGAPPMLIEGVQLNVRPEVIIREVDNRNRPGVGAIKFYFPKSKKLSAERAAYMGVMLHWFCEHLFEDEADHRCCSVIDVTGGKIHTAPKATKRKRNDIQGACEEIRLRFLGG